jgi:EAL domain-containing protein (putative c-di-GMP-specific phosphodiesterase class I)
LEALLCARQADGGLIMGSELLSAAKRCALAEAMGERLIHAVCGQLSAWRERGEQLFPVALVVASEQLRQPQRLLESIVTALHEHDLAAELLALEVSDLDLAHDSLPALAALRELDALGVRIVASGFGAARGALTQLVRVPLRGVALDEALLTNGHEPRARAVLRSLIEMGHTLQCSVLGKGVEIAEQLDTLRELGADSYQGELLSPPLPAGEVDQFLMGQRHMAFVAHVGQVSSIG